METEEKDVLLIPALVQPAHVAMAYSQLVTVTMRALASPPEQARRTRQHGADPPSPGPQARDCLKYISRFHTRIRLVPFPDWRSRDRCFPRMHQATNCAMQKTCTSTECLSSRAPPIPASGPVQLCPKRKPAAQLVIVVAHKFQPLILNKVDGLGVSRQRSTLRVTKEARQIAAA